MTIPLKKRYGRLAVEALEMIWDARAGRNRLHVKARCDCGSVELFRVESLKCGFTLSCGCLHKDILSGRHKPVGQHHQMERRA